MGTKTALFSRKQSGGIFTIVDQSMTTGDIWFVDSNCSGGGTSSSYGRNPDSAFTTLAAAISAATASKGDIIYIMPGHTEAPTATITVSKAGLSVIGLGNGSNRPTFTHAHTAADDNIDVTAAGVKIKNIILAAGTNAAGATVQVNVANGAHEFEMSHCLIQMGATNQQCFTVAATAHRGYLHDLQITGTAAGPDTIIVWEGGSDDWRVEDIDAVFTAATDIDGPVFYQNAVAMENLIMKNIRVIAAKGDAVVLDFNSASTGLVSDMYVYTLATTFGEQFDLGSLATHNVLVAGAGKKAMPYPAATLAI